MVGYILNGVRLLLLLFSFWGYAQVLRDRFKLQTEFVLPVVFSSLGAVMFFAGILNALAATAYAVFLIGIVLGALSLKAGRKPLPPITVGTIVLTIVLAVLLVLTVGNKFTHYDNFSHWATVLKHIIKTETLPNFDDSYIIFQSYPVGSASFIYYFSKITGVQSEWFCIFVQQVLTCSMLCSVFAFFKSKKILSVVFGTVTVFLVLFADVEFTVTHDILVDILVPAIAIAAFALCFYYREDIKTCTLPLIPILVFLISVKNSGLLFAVMVLLYYVYRSIRSYGIIKLFTLSNAALCLSPVLTSYLWSRHVEYVFSYGQLAKHSMTLEYYKQMRKEKTDEIIAKITDLFFDRVFSAENAILIICLLLVALFVLKTISKTKSDALYDGAAVIALFYFSWMFGLWGTYILSMPTEEALFLAGYDRYAMTGYIFCFGILIIVLGDTLKSFTLHGDSFLLNKLMPVACCIAVSICTLFGLSSDPLSYDGTMYLPERRETFDTAISGYDIELSGDGRLFVVCDGEGYEYYMCMYLFKTEKISVCSTESFEQRLSEIDQCEYLITVKHTETVDAYLFERFGYSNENVYKLK